MSEPPSHADHGNVVDPDVFAQRRARRAEVGEDAALEVKLLDAEQRLSEVEAERDTLRAVLDAQQRRAEVEDAEPIEVSAAAAELASVREHLERAEALLATVTEERDRARGALYQARMSAEAAAARRTALEREHTALRQELDRRAAIARDTAAAVASARAAIEGARLGNPDAAALVERLERESAAFAEQVEAVEGAVAAVRDRLAVAMRELTERLEAEQRRRVAAETALVGEREALAEAEARAQVVADGRGAAEARAQAAAQGLRALEGILSDERAARADVEAELAQARTARAELAGELALEREAHARAEAEMVAEREGRLGMEAQLVAERDAARAEQERLEAELARHAEVEASLRAELEALRAEVATLRAGDDERTQRMAARVDAVVGLAAQLREGVARARASEEEALTAALEAMQARMVGLQETVAEAAQLREELETERAARWALEAELDAERQRGTAQREARAAAEARVAEVETRLLEVEAELEELRAAPPAAASADPESIASLRAALEQLRGAEPAETAAPSLGLDLAAAAERLRASAETTAPTPTPTPTPTPDTPAPEASRDDSWSMTDHQSSLDVEGGAEGEREAAGSPAEPVRSPLPRRAPIANPGPWLRDTLVSLAADEPEIAELLVSALLPAQAGLVARPLTYDLLPDGGMAQRVVLTPGQARLVTPGDGPGGADACVAGPLAALVPLAAGGATRRLPGARVEGRWALRRLLKARRSPLGLAELAASGAAPAPGLLLTILARAVDPSWIAGRPLAVDVVCAGADRWRVESLGEGPLAVLPAAGRPPAPAALHTQAGRLAAVLSGTAEPDEAWVEGDLEPVRRLLGWLDRAQRAER